MKAFDRLLRIVIGFVLCLCLTTQPGCAFKRNSATWKPTTIRVLKERGLANDYIAVDIIGVDDGMKERIKTAVTNGTYFQIGNSVRKSVLDGQPAWSFEFPPGSDSDKPKTIERRDKMWRAWKTNGISLLVVVANLDSRQNAVKIINYEKYKQSGAKRSITFRLTSAGIACFPANIE